MARLHPTRTACVPQLETPTVSVLHAQKKWETHTRIQWTNLKPSFKLWSSGLWRHC